MKKITWLFSMNASGASPLDSGGIRTWQFLFDHGVKFQKDVKAALAPEGEVTFVSYDIWHPEIPVADLIIYNEVDAPYLDEKMKQTALSIPYKLYYTKDIEAIKSYILSHM